MAKKDKSIEKLNTATVDGENLTGLERQKAFLESTKKRGLSGDSFFITDKVMESMRDSGYRDIRKAINDLIDNSEQAGAKKIVVATTSAREDAKGARERISNIAVIDDGHGMFPDMMKFAIAWGGTDRHDQRDGLGRFGFGLPTAAVSVTRLYEVYSKVKGNGWSKVRVDLNEITQQALTSGGNIAFHPTIETEKIKLPDFVKESIKAIWKKDDLDNGTVILLAEPDRIRSFALPQKFQSKMMENIGLTYRHFMPSISFYVNENKVDMVDPLFLNPVSRGYDVGNGHIAEGMDDLIMKVKNKLNNGEQKEGQIRFKFSLMHPKFQRDAEGQLIPERFKTMKENNGYFIVCRAGRQIDVVKDTGYQSDSDNVTLVNYDANWAIEVDFDPILDELFGITTNKQQVEIDSYLWDIFKENGIPGIVKAFRMQLGKQRNSEKKNQASEDPAPRASEQVMTDASKFDAPNVPKEKKAKANKKLEDEAKKKATNEKKPVDQATRELEAEVEGRKFKIEFTELPGAPFYDVELVGAQTKIKINSSHRFYNDIYAQQDARGKTAIELMLFALGRCEADSTGDVAIFYASERFEWSKKLDLHLRLLDKLDPLLDKESFEEEEEEQEA